MRDEAKYLIAEVAVNSGVSASGNDVIAQQCHRTAIPKRFSLVVRDIWDLQIRLERRQLKRLKHR